MNDFDGVGRRLQFELADYQNAPAIDTSDPILETKDMAGIAARAATVSQTILISRLVNLCIKPTTSPIRTLTGVE